MQQRTEILFLVNDSLQIVHYFKYQHASFNRFYFLDIIVKLILNCYYNG